MEKALNSYWWKKRDNTLTAFVEARRRFERKDQRDSGTIGIDHE
jgi:hypothetical protein